MTANVLSETEKDISKTTKGRRRSLFLHYMLWIVQGLLAAIFLFAGIVKLTTPVEILSAQMLVPLPILFLQFISVTEVLGAIGLILPGLLHIRVGLTPLAATGLVIIMIGATIITLIGGGGSLALVPLLLGLLAAFVAYGRWQLRPLNE